MQNSPRDSSSDLGRARALALRLSQDPASRERAPAPPPPAYVRFSASRFRGALEEAPRVFPAQARGLGREPAVARSETAAARFDPAAARRDPAPARREPTAARPEPRVVPPEPPVPQPEPPPPPASATARMAPPPPPPLPPRTATAAWPAAPHPEPPPPPAPAEAEEGDEPAVVDTPVDRDEPEAETDLAMEEVPDAPASAKAEPASFPALNPEPSEFEEDLEPLAWPQILEDCVYLARGRGAFVMNAKGQINEVTGPWPKPKLEPIGTRLIKLMDEEAAERAKGAPPVTPTLQLGTFCLTGLRVTIAGQDITVGLIAETPLSAEARPAVEAELRRGKPF